MQLFQYHNDLIILILIGIVFVIFLLCWTPHHVDRIMFIIVTMTSSWNDTTADAQDWIHLIAGNKNILNRPQNFLNLLIGSKSTCRC